MKPLWQKFGCFGKLSSWSLTVRTDRVLLPSFSLLEYTVKPRFTDTRLIRTPRYYGRFALSLRKQNPEISLHSTRLIRTFSMAPSVSAD